MEPRSLLNLHPTRSCAYVDSSPCLDCSPQTLCSLLKIRLAAKERISMCLCWSPPGPVLGRGARLPDEPSSQPKPWAWLAGLCSAASGTGLHPSPRRPATNRTGYTQRSCRPYLKRLLLLRKEGFFPLGNPTNSWDLIKPVVILIVPSLRHLSGRGGVETSLLGKRALDIGTPVHATASEQEEEGTGVWVAA